MADRETDQPGDRIIIKLDPGQPMELTGLSDSFAALARFYERNYRVEGEKAPKLFITKLETGSIIAEIAPYLEILGSAIYTMDTGIIVADFTTRLSRGIRAFASLPQPAPAALIEAPSNEDAADIREFVRPLTGKRGAELGIKHARLEKQDGERRILVEYKFDEAELNRAAINIDEALASPDRLSIAAPLEEDSKRDSYLKEVMLFFQQATRGPGKDKGRTGDKGIIPSVSPEPLAVYFRKSFQDLKERMVRGELNPLTHTFVVDVSVQYVDGVPKGYIVTEVHQVMPTDP